LSFHLAEQETAISFEYLLHVFTQNIVSYALKFYPERSKNPLLLDQPITFSVGHYSLEKYIFVRHSNGILYKCSLLFFVITDTLHTKLTWSYYGNSLIKSNFWKTR